VGVVTGLTSRHGWTKGVRRGKGVCGAIYVNGHRPLNPATRRHILEIMDVDRPVTTKEVWSQTHYALQYVQDVLRWMAIDGDILREGRKGQVVLWSLPPKPVKVCTICQVRKPLNAYHHDKSTPDGLTRQCMVCREDRRQARLAEAAERVEQEERDRAAEGAARELISA